jgi:hypothetical protein
MARKSANAYLRLFILLPGLWLLPTTQPALSQVSLPADFISPNVPHDVPAGPSASVQDLAIFAWQEFIALNWVAMDPQTTGLRGRPDTSADFFSIKPDSNGNFPLVVWHTYQHKNEMFPASGQTLSSFDSKAPVYDYMTQPPAATPNATLNLFNNLDETSQIGLALMFAHYVSSTDNIRIAYEAKANRAVFDYLNANGFTNCPGSFCQTLSTAKSKTMNNLAQYGGICSTDPTIVSLPCGDATVTGDAGEGAIEIKAAWRKLTAEEQAKGRFFTQTVTYYTGGQSPAYNNAVYGLLSLHIIHKTKSFPAFVFATWEQVDNYDDATNQNTEDLAFTNLSTPFIPSIPVARAHPIHSQVSPVNDAVRTAFIAKDPTTIWQYYKLIGVQATPVGGPPAATAPTDSQSYYYLANIVVETNQTLQNFFGSVNSEGMTQAFRNVYLNGASGSPFQMGGCQGCHGTQAQSLGGDMSRIIAIAPYDSIQAPETIDSDVGTALLSYQNRSQGEPPPPRLRGPRHGPCNNRSDHGHGHGPC